MRKRTVESFILILLVISTAAAQTDDEKVNMLLERGAENLLFGRLSRAYDDYKEASLLYGSTEDGQLALIKSWQILYELGDYRTIPSEAAFLVTSGQSEKVKREALMIEVRSLAVMGLTEQALSLAEKYDSQYGNEPSWLFLLYDLYDKTGNSRDRDRAGWLLRSRIPESPEGLILTGEAEKSQKPSLLFKEMGRH